MTKIGRNGKAAQRTLFVDFDRSLGPFLSWRSSGILSKAPPRLPISTLASVVTYGGIMGGDGNGSEPPPLPAHVALGLGPSAKAPKADLARVITLVFDPGNAGGGGDGGGGAGDEDRTVDLVAPSEDTARTLRQCFATFKAAPAAQQQQQQQQQQPPQSVTSPGDSFSLDDAAEPADPKSAKLAETKRKVDALKAKKAAAAAASTAITPARKPMFEVLRADESDPAANGVEGNGDDKGAAAGAAGSRPLFSSLPPPPSSPPPATRPVPVAGPPQGLPPAAATTSGGGGGGGSSTLLKRKLEQARQKKAEQAAAAAATASISFSSSSAAAPPTTPAASPAVALLMSLGLGDGACGALADLGVAELADLAEFSDDFLEAQLGLTSEQVKGVRGALNRSSGGGGGAAYPSKVAAATTQAEQQQRQGGGSTGL